MQNNARGTRSAASAASAALLLFEHDSAAIPAIPSQNSEVRQYASVPM